MATNINEILNAARDDRVETKIISLEEEPKPLYDIVTRIKLILKRTQYEDIAKLSNYDLFQLYFCFNNDTMSMIHTGQIQYFDASISYEELYGIIEESKDYINTWSFSKTYNALRKVIDAKTQQELINACQQLGLNPYIISYDIKQAFIAMTNLLFYRAEVERIQKSNKTTSLKKKELRDLYNKIMSETISIIVERYDSTKRFYRERKEACEIKLRCIDELIAASDAGELETMDLIEGTWHQYLSTTVLNPLYDHLLDNQYKRHQKVTKKNQELNDQINETQFINYLYQNNIDPSSLDEKTLQEANNSNFDELIIKIEFFKRIGYTLPEILINYLATIFTIEISIINKLNTYLDKHIIKPETIHNNLSIINSINIIDTNYSILKPIIDINSIYYDDKILLLEPTEIKRRISILALYKNFSKNNYMFLLSNIKYLKIYDLMLENNIPLYLLITICKQYNPLLTIKKILICQQLDIPYEKDGILIKEIKRPNSFMCPDENIDDYIDNAVSFYSTENVKSSEVTDIETTDFIKDLDIHHKRKDTYVFGNTTISRPKVLRNLQTVKNKKQRLKEHLFFAMISDSILDEGNIQELKNATMKKTI
jgi:hypothetical protein